jgi:REP element-mobilizing transposase RayT
MTQQHQQNHATWECKYHVVFIPKYRKKAIFGVIKKRLGECSMNWRGGAKARSKKAI